ncbi:MAG: tyrosine-type recombinase/integrase, partial [Gammaproteobacteria bacterium]|nr:tyrosine-type recombinase/integrase [Gammaproteobacteria bacterium]
HIPKDKLKAWFESVNAIDPRGGNDAARDLLIFTLLTGLRRNEAAQLEWSRVDLDDKSFSILENKAGRPFQLPLSDYLYQMLARRKKTAGRRSYVFPAGNKAGYLTDWRHWTRQIGEEIGLSFTPHDLRRTFATVAESLDISPYTIKALVNHSLPSDDVTGGYIQIDVERLRCPMQQITDF